MDAWKLIDQTVGAAVADEDNSEYFYQQDDTKDRYEEGDSKAKHHWIRLIPYLKSWWAIQHPYEAKKNYEFGRKMNAR